MAYCYEVKAPRSKPFAEELFRDVADWDNPAAPQNHAFEFWRAMRKPENAARGHQLGNLHRRHGKAAFAKPQQNERLRSGLDRLDHSGKAIPSPGSASGSDSGTSEASSKANSSAVKNPSGFTTGITF